MGSYSPCPRLFPGKRYSPPPQTLGIILPTADGREIWLRRVTISSPEQNEVLRIRGITLQERLQLNFERSVNSAVAKLILKTLTGIYAIP